MGTTAPKMVPVGCSPSTRAASVTNADLVTWSRSAASEMSWSVASSVRSSMRRFFVVVMVVPPHTTVRDLYGYFERGGLRSTGPGQSQHPDQSGSTRPAVHEPPQRPPSREYFVGGPRFRGSRLGKS